MYPLSDFFSLLPPSGFPWNALERAIQPVFYEMEHTPQNPRWHAEGNVLNHTKLVCHALLELEQYRNSDTSLQTILCLGALLHDIGKTRTTVLEDGQWTSRGHGRRGAEMARQLLWRDLNLCGTPDKQQLRETVCALVRYHSMPPYALENRDGKRRLIRAASNGVLLTDFTIRLLCTLAEADALGRICQDRSDMRERNALCAELAQEAGCLDSPYPFPSAHTAFSYCAGKNVLPEHPLYDGTWGPVILMCGLPGTGKDTWILDNCPDIPMISLDAIRAELGFSHTQPQAKILDTARQRAKELLRSRTPFVWNATSLLPVHRQQQIDLFTSYGAAVRIVYLETPWQEMLRRNASRNAVVPEADLCRALEKLSPPEPWEAHRVEWYCV